jgi:methylated-DNA-[protein]-cysteine S-methyltransferase
MDLHNRYVSFSSAFGTIGMVWRETGSGPKVLQILLPSEKTPLGHRLAEIVPHPARQSCAPVTELGERIQAFLVGHALGFELDLIDWGNCSGFQRSVLLAEHRIPRGWVSTYGRIARSLGVKGGARAVGSALARNPFPIVIPCHRTIRAGGKLGGYQGGLKMKRALLKMDGVEVSVRGRVALDRMYY